MAWIIKTVKTLLLTLGLILFLAVPLPARAQAIARSYLTPEILQTRTSNVVQQEGRDTIDLSNLIIDLANVDSEFNQDFYQHLNNIISHATKPINLNFNNSIIQGDFLIKRLGIASSMGMGTLSSLFTSLEQEKINQLYPLQIEQAQELPRVNIFRGSLFFSNTIFTGNVDSSDSLYLQTFIADKAEFQEEVDFTQAIFAQELDFSQAVFAQGLSFAATHCWGKVKFSAAEFSNMINFSKSQFEAAVNFNQAIFNQLADFSRIAFMETVDFSQAIFRDRLTFAKSKFLNSLLLMNSSLEKTVTFRDIYLNALINLEDAHLLNRLDFSNAFFTPQASINVSGLAFDAAESQIVGQPGIISKYLSLKRLQGNELVFRNLILNFRRLEQIKDANELEYKQKKLQLKAIGDRLTKTSWGKIFTWSWLILIFQWSSLSLLLLLGDYGTNINSIFSVGIVSIALFSLLFWLIDRYRPNISQAVIPKYPETIAMVLSYVIITSLAIINIFLATDRPWLTLSAISIFLLPIPILIASLIYQGGRYHKLLDVSYFVENGQDRELRLLIGRLPIMPRFSFYRDRFMPLLWEKRWNWLNYYDFSLNNIFKLGFNDIRLRDQHLPGLISALVWYQWCLGVLYIVLLLWTISRTIPGLNLLIYF
ncbi:MAG: pentapeptide repeat-containing protein [Cyanobacteria bacterium P01_C01_bin.72]